MPPFAMVGATTAQAARRDARSDERSRRPGLVVERAEVVIGLDPFGVVAGHTPAWSRYGLRAVRDQD